MMFNCQSWSSVSEVPSERPEIHPQPSAEQAKAMQTPGSISPRFFPAGTIVGNQPLAPAANGVVRLGLATPPFPGGLPQTGPIYPASLPAAPQSAAVLWTAPVVVAPPVLPAEVVVPEAHVDQLVATCKEQLKLAKRHKIEAALDCEILAYSLKQFREQQLAVQEEIVEASRELSQLTPVSRTRTPPRARTPPASACTLGDLSRQASARENGAYLQSTLRNIVKHSQGEELTTQDRGTRTPPRASSRSVTPGRSRVAHDEAHWQGARRLVAEISPRRSDLYANSTTNGTGLSPLARASHTVASTPSLRVILPAPRPAAPIQCASQIPHHLVLVAPPCSPPVSPPRPGSKYTDVRRGQAFRDAS